MRSRLLALSVLLVAGGALTAQTAAPPKEGPKLPSKAPPAVRSALEEALAQALKDNPDLKVAVAKVNEAEAQLSRTRLLVVQKVVTQHRAIEQAKGAVTVAAVKFENTQTLFKNKVLSRGELTITEQQLAQAKANLANAEAEMAFLRGRSAAKLDDSKAYREALNLYYSRLATAKTADSYWLDRRVMPGVDDPFLRWKGSVKGAQADKWRQALNRRISIKFTDGTAADLLRYLQKTYPDVPIRAIGRGGPWLEKVTVEMKDVALGATLEFLEDTLDGYRIVVREYGFLIAPKDRAPPGAMLLHEFWKGQVTADKPAKTSVAPDDVKGSVKSVDGPSGLLSITVGSDAGLTKGHVLHVYRLAPTPKYLGAIEVLEVAPKQATARAKGRMAGNVMVGDQVVSQIKAK